MYARVHQYRCISSIPLVRARAFAESIGAVSTSIDGMSTLVGSVTDELKDDVTTLVGSVGDDLNDDVSKLQSTVGNMQLILILTLIVAAISLILPLVRKS